MTAVANGQRPRGLTIWHLMMALPWVAVGIVARGAIRDNSFLWHIRAGSLQTEMGQVLTADPFSFTKLGEAWRTQSWLAELGYAWGERTWDLSYVPWMVVAAALVLFIALAVIYGFAFSVSASLTRQHRASRRLLQEVALLEERLRRLETTRDGESRRHRGPGIEETEATDATPLDIRVEA